MTAIAELRTRDAFRHHYRDTTKADVAFALQVAQTPAEVDAAAHLSLVLFGVAAALAPFTDDRGRAWRSLQLLTHEARHRVHGFPETLAQTARRMNAISANAADARRREAIAARAERDRRIEQIGITNVSPNPGGNR